MKKLLYILFAAVLLTGCKWDDYTTDYVYTSVYVANQNQLRTIIADGNMSFEIGAYMGGRRENNNEEWVKYRLEPSLLTNTAVVGSNNFTLLPSTWYTLSDPGMMRIHKGSFLGKVTVTLNQALFTADPLSTQNTYALPIRIYETSVDTILQGKYNGLDMITEPKDYAVIVVKYINPYQGNYYDKGTQTNQATGEVITYKTTDLSRNKVIALKTLSLTESSTTTMGASVSTETTKLGLKLTVQPNNSVLVEVAPGATGVEALANTSGSYDPASRTFTLGYDYTVAGVTYRVSEQYIWRDTTLSFEQW